MAREIGAKAKVSQDHLDRSAAVINSLVTGKTRGAPDDVQRYAFVPLGRHLFALKAPRGSRTAITCGGISYPVRVPRTRAELAAVLRVETVLPASAKPLADDVPTIMARRIVAGAQRNPPEVSRRDFRQAGIREDLIDANFDAAMKLARRMEPRLDAMGALS